MTLQNSPNHGAVPIVIGVTGHRDIPSEDYEILEKSVRKYLREDVLNKYPNSPIVFLSALAEGADRIAAQAALSEGCQLGVFLPFQQEDYLNDFDSEDSKSEFKKLVSLASFVNVVEVPVGQGADDRDKGYVAVGVAIARYSQCLLALWDGVDNGKAGGTSDIVKIYREGIPMQSSMPDDLLTPPECGPVEHFWTRRASNKNLIPQVKVGGRRFLHPVPFGHVGDESELGKLERGRWDKVLSCIDQFNKDASTLPDFSKDKPYTSGYLCSKEQGIPWPSDDVKANRIAKLYASADALSGHAQTKRRSALMYIIALSFIALIFEQAYGFFSQPICLAVAIVLVLIAGWKYLAVGRERLEEKYLDYRTLAEAARVQFFWHISGISDCASEHYLQDQRDELEWLRQAIRAIDLPVNETVSLPEHKVGIGISLISWVQNQLEYFKDKYPKHNGSGEKLSKQAGWWFLAAIFMVIFSAIFHESALLWFPDINEMAISALPGIYSLLFGIAGVLKFYEGIMAYKEQANRYMTMIPVFSVCSNRIEIALKNDDIPAAKELLLAVGRAALAENGEWLMLHRERPIEVPIG